MKQWLGRLSVIEAEILKTKHKAETNDIQLAKNSADARKIQREAITSKLETERRFILDRRNGWKAKSLWNILVPIMVTVFTTVVLNRFGWKL